MKYTTPEMKVVMFETEEVIVASTPSGDIGTGDGDVSGD